MSKIQAEKYIAAFEVISKINTLSKDGLRVKFGTSDPVKIQLITDINLNIIKELIDKETPKKPIYEGAGYASDGQLIYDTWICPDCEKRYELDYEHYNYCYVCGKIDWSDEE